VAGVVVEKGKNVTHLEIGDEIFSRVPSNAPGTFAEYIAIDSEVVIKKPANIDFAAAASIPLVGLTTVQCFDKARLKAGDKVLIHAGSGGVGTFAIQYAKAKSAHYHFVLMDPNASQLADIKTLIEKQLIKPVIDKVFPLSDAVEALLYQKSGRAKGKIVIGMK
jgi:NADPH:quinone reductase-like Zn-dependent oxidoreductase